MNAYPEVTITFVAIIQDPSSLTLRLVGTILDRSWQMSTTHVHCSSIVVVSWPVWAIVSAIDLDSDAAHSANVNGVAQTMTMKYDLACSLIKQYRLQI